MIVRECVRALIEDEDGRVLLMRIVEPSTSRAFWITPGGGCEDNESHYEALCRELYEETGLQLVSAGPLVWTQDLTFSWGSQTYRQLESTYWLKIPTFAAEPTALHGEMEESSFDELRWWTVDDIAASLEAFAPLDLSAQITRLRENGPPSVPIVLGI